MTLPEHYDEIVVSMEICIKDNEYKSIATGFLVGFNLNKKNEEGKDLYSTYLVTNKHVFGDKSNLWFKFNLKEGDSKRYLLDLIKKDKKIWLEHENKNVDLAVLPIDTNFFKKEGVELRWVREEDMMFIEIMKNLKISVGDEIFVVGFPMGLAGNYKKYVIVRKGIIARLDDEIITTENSFLIDSFIFPGNSGGPVILKPSFIGTENKPPINKAYIMGVVKSYILYTDIAYSSQTNLPRVSFMENSGLAEVIPLDYLRDIAKEHISKIDTVTIESPKKEVNE